MEVIQRPCNLAQAYKDNGLMFKSLSSSNSGASNIDGICWKSPKHDQVALNCDVVVIQLGNQAAYGGAIRDHHGAFICNFHAKNGSCAVIYAELWAILLGIKLAWSRGFRRIRVDSDSLNAIKLLEGSCSRFRPCYNLVRDIHQGYANSGNHY
ncbi:hypothetical protein JHK85_012603 [Glycine max]|uniref:Putative ribonuclease H protein n=1 Tax=Glycine soja TaxID=3848 RepID=A0A0B2P1D7_GLYSO|nr:hypothetical protein JHK85_012603 [Glycine max]KAG5057269.1 hypothetical protein JHK86_012265 [Glycine max]KHN01269.1 Putative ribonuclease H protein [Glycine soja]